MHAGAFGISTGLFYLPGIFSKVDEVIALSKVAADSGGIYTSHLRNEGAKLFDGVAEAIEIGKQAHIPIVLTHHKAVGQPNWGKSIVTLAMIDWARSAGIDVMADQYPYTASSTALAALFPPWALEGGDSAFRRRAKDPVLLDSLTRGIIWNLENDRGGGEIRRVQFASVGWNRGLEGRTLKGLGSRARPRADAGEWRQARGGGPARRRRQHDLPRHRRSRRRADHEASDDNDRVRRGAQPSRHGRAAPALLRHLSPSPRRVRAGEAGAHTGGRGAQDDLAPRAATRSQGSRHDRRRQRRRHHDLRPEGRE
jgi:hypothetical protein